MSAATRQSRSRSAGSRAANAVTRPISSAVTIQGTAASSPSPRDNATAAEASVAEQRAALPRGATEGAEGAEAPQHGGVLDDHLEQPQLARADAFRQERLRVARDPEVTGARGEREGFEVRWRLRDAVLLAEPE